MIITIMPVLLLYTARTKTHATHTQRTLFFSTWAKTLAFSPRRWEDGDNIPLRSHTSVSLSQMSCFFPSIKPQKKFISLFLSLRRVVYTYALREEKKKTKAFVLHYKTRLLLFLLRVLFFNIWPPFESEREGERGRHFKAEFGNCNFL